LEAVHENRCGTERRAMLHCQLVRAGKCVAEYSALNDVVAGKGTIARMADFDLFLNGVLICNYKADGLILATPTGSTAYSLASGGPIVYPTLDAIIVTPISPHALTQRPVVLPGSAAIRIRMRSASELYLTVDGNDGRRLELNEE